MVNAKPAKTKTPAINVLTTRQHVVHLGTLRNSFTAGFPLETSFCRAHQFCKLLPSVQLATIIGPGKMFSRTIAGRVVRKSATVVIRFHQQLSDLCNGEVPRFPPEVG